MILTAFFTAWGDLIRPGSLRVLGLGVALATGLLIAVYAAFAWFLGLVLPDTMTLPWIGEIGWVDTLVSWASLGLMLVLSVFLMVPVAAAFTGLFLDDVAEVVETAHYPGLPPVRRLSLAETMRDAMAFLGVILGANLVALLIYPFVIPFAPVLFLGLNGYLLGREYFHMAALRRMERDDALALYRANKATIWIAGALMAVPLSVPLLNLLVPVLGAATFTHLFHRIRGTS
ncbi:EI24 domain-containing protein [Phaeovulum sp. NW3]|uniref:EI24 domain-containing protein n=1 Tax=Phaeovulum sp. NW3 TaxID=2934933 RepID=UPI00202148BC|nr:EI24 domain-containing protein [Phaeovulum sp. NW3]MCL7464441.1 EI24 domain-containing protein [Phaeovulum sp. NW3]